MTNKYNHSKLYKLQCDDGYYYIGSTVQPLSVRLGGHKGKSKLDPERPVYRYILGIGWNHVKIVLVSEHCLENKEQLLREEDKLIREYKDDPLCLNTLTAINSENDKQKIKEKYREKNKNLLLNKHREYNELNSIKYKCICGSEITKLGRLRHERTKKHLDYINSHVASSSNEPNDDIKIQDDDVQCSV